jgi:hypothetical protein
MFIRFSIGFSGLLTSILGLLISGLSTRVLRVLVGVKPTIDFCFDTNSLLNLDLLDSNKASLILIRYSNLRIVARKVAFV